MYKVFINEKALFISENPIEGSNNINYVNKNSILEALDIVKYSSNQQVTLYNNEIEKLWLKFQKHFKLIHAAGGLVTNLYNELLVIKRLGKWDLPKGKVELNEKIEEAALREVEEECGISDLILGESFQTTYHVYFQNDYILKSTYWFLMKYEGNEQLIPQTEEGIEEVRWISMSDISKIKENTYGNISLLLDLFVLG